MHGLGDPEFPIIIFAGAFFGLTYKPPFIRAVGACGWLLSFLSLCLCHAHASLATPIWSRLPEQLALGTPIAGGFLYSAFTTGVSSSSKIKWLFAHESGLPLRAVWLAGYRKMREPETGRTEACHSQPKTEALVAEACILYEG